jgi:hypothetical protein
LPTNGKCVSIFPHILLPSILHSIITNEIRVVSSSYPRNIPMFFGQTFLR